ncbi:FlgD immunoglobulin-like domain containing protein [Jatrophihabitans endophyticus]|uniref:FlgD immunoglobulin-like domain containing protein n=1 Tax=Jatrophihabitans endophyticus TaxID=1206085 RepID=UPI001A0E79A2|nr:FlgD immunoglobulin-like domain containing protein [Jatrophihabitans endophyticus]MBE7188339.1 hypothetical protein [Jatrophihabitans endophyticus]
MKLRAGATAALLAAGLVALYPNGTVAAAAPPAAGGPVRISATQATTHAKSFFLDTASTDWVLFTVDSTMYAERAGGGPAVRVPDASYDAQIAGDLVIHYSASKRHQVDFYDLSDGTSGVGETRWVAAAPNGGVYVALDQTDGVLHAYVQDVRTGGVTDLGALTGFDDTAPVSALNDDDGVVFFQSYTSAGQSHNRASYVSYDHPGTVTPLRTHDQGWDTCRSLAADALGCAGGGHSVFRVPLDGSAPQVIPVTFPHVPKAARVSSLAFVTPTRTFWSFEYNEDEAYYGPRPDQPLRSVPADSPGATPVTTSFDLTNVIDEGDFPVEAAAGGDSLYVTRYGSPAHAGVYRVSSGSTDRVPFHVVGAEKVVAHDLAVGSGQVVFADDSAARYGTRIRTRLFTRSGNTIKPGKLVDLTTHGDEFDTVVASASRVLYADDNGVHIVPVAGTGSAHHSTYVARYFPVALSGTRAVLRGFRGGDYVLVDLVNGHRTDLTTKYRVWGDPALFGNYLAYATKDGSIHRLDLVSKKSVTLAGRPKTAHGGLSPELAMWGDYVAWDYLVSYQGDTQASFFRDARTMTPKVRLPEHDVVVGASDEGVTLAPADFQARSSSTSVRPWTSNRVRVVHSGEANVGSSTAAYTRAGDDPTRTGDGTVYAQPLTHGTDRPRSLGNPFTSPRTSRGHVWHLTLPTSAALNHCSVSIRRHGHSVRTLSCGRTLMSLGEVSVSWNGRTRSGHRAGKGTYRAVVSARNADGTLLAADGSHASTSRTVTVR